MDLTYDGTVHMRRALIDSDTSPWVEVSQGRRIDWTRRVLKRVPCPCGESGEVVVPGVLDAVDGPFGVQRCDACGMYDDDRDAALALAALVGGTVRFTVDLT